MALTEAALARVAEAEADRTRAAAWRDWWAAEGADFAPLSADALAALRAEDRERRLRAAIEDPDPVMVLEPKKLYRMASGPYPSGPYRVPIGRAALRRRGDDLTIIAYGTMAHFAIQASDRLRKEDIEAAVLDLRSLRPLDWPSIERAVRRNGKVLIVHEDNKFGGFGADGGQRQAEGERGARAR